VSSARAGTHTSKALNAARIAADRPIAAATAPAAQRRPAQATNEAQKIAPTVMPILPALETTAVSATVNPRSETT
jgi:hypothetical protein